MTTCASLCILELGHVTTYGYDPLNRLVTVTDPLSHTVSYTYDAVGNRVGQLKADGTAMGYTYDALDRLVAVVSGTTTVAFAYNGDGV